MASTSVSQDTASRKYTDKQKSMLVHCLIKNKPIGEEGDGKMQKKMETCYTAVADSFNQLNVEQTAHLTTSKRSPPRFVTPTFCKAFFGECLKRHNKLALEKGVNRHIRAGETGQAADGQPANVNQAIQEADKVWSDFGAFHAAFGTLQRLRNDVFCETLSPMPRPGASTDVPRSSNRRQHRGCSNALTLPCPCPAHPLHRSPRRRVCSARLARPWPTVLPLRALALMSFSTMAAAGIIVSVGARMCLTRTRLVHCR
jgi:hypothetical protein